MNTRPLLNRSRGDGFSIIELLIVITIIAILSAITASSIASQSGARALVNGGNLLTNLANQSRQRAITLHTMTALVLVRKSGTPDWDYRLFRIMKFIPASSTSSASWQASSKWHMLPKGAIIDPTQSASFISFSQTVSLPIAMGSLPYQDRTLTPDSYSFLIFLPDGRLLSTIDTSDPDPTPPSLRVVQGRMNGGSVVYTGPHPGGQPLDYYEITFNVFTGIAKVDRP